MLNYKFIQVLRTFSKEEFNLFHKFLKSPVYNTNKNLITLLQIIKRFHPFYVHDNLTKKILHQKLFPDLSFKDKRLRNLSAEMLSLIEEFLLFIRSERNSIEKKIEIIGELNDRGLEKLVIRHYKKVLYTFNKLAYMNQSIILQLLKLNDIIKENEFYSHINIKKNPGIIYAEVDLSMEYISMIALNLALEAKLLEDSEIKLKDLRFIEKIINNSEELIKKSPTLMLYKNCLTLLTKTDRRLFEELKGVFFKNIQNLDGTTKAILRSVLTLYHMNHESEIANEEYYKEQLTLMGPPNEHIIGGFIRDNIFNLYVINYLYSTNFVGCLQFINKFGKYLKQQGRTKVINFNLSKYFLFKGYYKEALEYAIKCNQKYWWYYIHSQTTAIICCYELENYKNVQLYSAKLKKYIKSSLDIPMLDSLSIDNFLTCIDDLVMKKNKPNKELDSAINTIKNKRISHSKWILKKYSEIADMKKAAS